MSQGKFRWAIGVVALLGAITVASVAVLRSGSELAASVPVQSPVSKAGTKFPDGERTLRDFKGVLPDGTLWEMLPGGRTEFWGSYDFGHQGGRYHAAFYTLANPVYDEFNRSCPDCAPSLGAVTYEMREGEWVLVSTDFFIADIGSYGHAAGIEKSRGLSLGGTPAIAVQSTAVDRGDSVESVFLLAYRNGWKQVAIVPTAADNAGARECTEGKRCFAWKGKLDVLDGPDSQLPDVEVAREGTEMGSLGGRVQPASPVTYQFDGKAYQVKVYSPGAAILGERSVENSKAQRSDTASPASGRRWYSVDLTATTCMRSHSPADRIELIQSLGQHAKTKDLPNGAVEVSKQATALTETTWTYYPDEASCVAALPSSQAIPSRYR